MKTAQLNTQQKTIDNAPDGEMSMLYGTWWRSLRDARSSSSSRSNRQLSNTWQLISLAISNDVSSQSYTTHMTRHQHITEPRAVINTTTSSRYARTISQYFQQTNQFLVITTELHSYMNWRGGLSYTYHLSSISPPQPLSYTARLCQVLHKWSNDHKMTVTQTPTIICCPLPTSITACCVHATTVPTYNVTEECSHMWQEIRSASTTTIQATELERHSCDWTHTCDGGPVIRVVLRAGRESELEVKIQNHDHHSPTSTNHHQWIR